MDAELLHQSDYIKAVEFGGRDVTLTITSVDIEELEDTKGKKKKMGLIGFRKTPKRWVLNVTNLRCLIAMLGRETDDWIGKRVTLFPAANDKSDSGVAIRVRGSPDLSADIKFKAKIGRDGEKSFHLRATGNSKPSTQTTQQPSGLGSDEPDADEQAEIRAREAEEAANRG